MILLIAVLTVIGCMIVVWQRRHRDRPPRVRDQWGALAVMGDLCPDGWQAEITLQGGAPIVEADDLSDKAAVALKWKLYEDHGEHPAIARRVSADTISEALQMMVDDRCIDVTLEQIERSAEGRL